jgi:hypothetical protein
LIYKIQPQKWTSIYLLLRVKNKNTIRKEAKLD